MTAENQKERTIGFVTDGGSDLERKEAEEKKIKIVPLEVRFRYKDGREDVLTQEDDLLSLMQQYPDHKRPKTSQPSIGQFLEAFTSFPEEFHIISVDVAAGKEKKQISGTFNSAQMAADMVNEDPVKYGKRKVMVFNSGTVSAGTRAILMKAVNSESNDPKQILKELEEVRGRLRLYAFLYNIGYVAERMTDLKTLLAIKLKIAPVLRVFDDEIVPQSKHRTPEAAKEKMVSLITEGEENEEVGVMHFAAKDEAKEMQERLKKALKDKYEGDIPIFKAKDLIGSYCGPDGAIGVYTIKKKA